ncbi:flippase [Halobacteriovorax sp. ZH5_bin.2]|uniref:flippase n=1 Tax=Halobacteriovorax sp. ZH5_bin.2 TaxID=3157727 RepID=UPI00371B108B
MLKGNTLKYIKNTSWMLSEKIVRLLGAIFITAWVARYLGPSEFGILSYAQSYVLALTAFTILGLDELLVRDLAEEKYSASEILINSFILRLLVSLIFYFVLILLVGYTETNFLNKDLIYIIGLSILFKPFDVIRYFLESRMRGRDIALIGTFSIIIASVLKILAVFYKRDIYVFAYITLVEHAFLATLYIFAIFKYKPIIKTNYFNIYLIKKYFRSGLPLSLTFVAFTLYMRIDQLMIEKMLNSYELGIYSVAVKLSSTWYFVPTIIAASLFPILLKAQSAKEIFNYKLVLSASNWLMICMALFMSLFGEKIILGLFGTDYVRSALILSIHIWSGVFISMNVISGKYYITKNMFGFLLLRTVVGLVINIVLNSFFITSFGIIGAAYSTLISFFVAALLIDLTHKDSKVMFSTKLSSLSPFVIINYLKFKIKKA